MIVKIVFISLLFLSYHSQNTCSAYCDFYFDGINNGLGCTAETPTTCTHCFTEIFQLSSTTCILRSDLIYNSTHEVSLTTWQQNDTSRIYLTYSTPTITYSLQYMRFDAQTLAAINYTIPSVGHYGFRCRFWVLNDDITNNRMYFYVNSSHEYYLTQNFSDSSFVSTSWIYTTDFISYTDPVVQFAFKRNDTQGSTDPTGFKELMVILAECVHGCSTCTSLTDCSACTGATFLNNLTNLCVDSCPPGMFESPSISNFCDWCDPLCAECMTSLANCQKCTDTGFYESFLFGSICYTACPNGYQSNYESHICECPAIGYYQNLGTCYTCHAYCNTCFGSSANDCYDCNDGYYLQNSTNICSIYCPSGEYYRPGIQIQQCYQCDASCHECENSSTTCTSCVFVSADRFLYDHQCLSQCPAGYENNTITFVCDLCALDTYSYKGTCISQCPQYYTESIALRACVLSDTNGFPINITVVVNSKSEIQLQAELLLGISSTNETDLRTDWENRIKLYLNSQSQTIFVNRRLQTPTQISITSFSLTSNLLTLTTYVQPSTISSDHSFYLIFSDNIYSTDNVIYTISSTYSLNDNPWILEEYYSLNLPYFNIISIPFLVISIILLLFRIKYTFYVWIQYIHCIQLLGLTVYAVFPHSISLNLYSFLLGLNYANFSFIYNLPLNLIQPCTQCSSLTGFSFAQGDMNFLRSSGSILQLLVVFSIIIIILLNVKCSYKYGLKLLSLIVALTFIKIFHSWFASLLYSGLNMNFISTDLDYLIVGTHFISIFLIGAIIFQQYRWQKKHGFINIRIMGIVIYSILLTLFSLAPVLLSAIFVTYSIIQCAYIHFYSINDFGVPEKKKKIQKPRQGQVMTSTTQIEQENEKPKQQIFHQQLLRLMKPITAILIASIMMIEQGITTIIIVSVFLGLIFLLAIIDTILLYSFNSKRKVQTDLSPKINQTMENMKDNQKIQIQDIREASNANESSSNDDDVVYKKFKTKNKNHMEDFIKPQPIEQ